MRSKVTALIILPTLQKKILFKSFESLKELKMSFSFKDVKRRREKVSV